MINRSISSNLSLCVPSHVLCGGFGNQPKRLARFPQFHLPNSQSTRSAKGCEIFYVKCVAHGQNIGGVSGRTSRLQTKSWDNGRKFRSARALTQLTKTHMTGEIKFCTKIKCFFFALMAHPVQRGSNCTLHALTKHSNHCTRHRTKRRLRESQGVIDYFLN